MTPDGSAAVVLRNGLEAQFLHVDEADAEDVLRYLDRVAAETNFLSFAPGEHGLAVADEALYLRGMRRDGTGFMLKAVVQGAIVALASLRWATRPRIRHVGEFAVSVVRDHWGAGLG